MARSDLAAFARDGGDPIDGVDDLVRRAEVPSPAQATSVGVSAAQKLVTRPAAPAMLRVAAVRPPYASYANTVESPSLFLRDVIRAPNPS